MRKKLLVFSGLAIASLLFVVTNCASKATVKNLNRKNAVQIIKRDASRYTEPATLVAEGATAVSNLRETPGASEFIIAELTQAENLPRTGFLHPICVTLTEQGKALSTQWEKVEGHSANEGCPYDAAWTVPVASLQALEVTGIRNTSDITALVDFEVQYKLNETGEAFKSGGVDNPLPFARRGSDLGEDTFRYTASLELYDDGWRLMSVQ